MIRDHFRVLVLDVGTGRAKVAKVEGRDQVAGGSGLAALLFGLYGKPDRPWDDPEQPFILAIGPLTGYFPLMSKTVAGFKSPYHDQYAESHAGGRSALALRFADYDALVLVGRAARPCVVAVGSRQAEVREAGILWGMDALGVGKHLRQMFPGSGHRSILRIGPAGEQRSAMACINVDTYRHFGRLGSGAVLGAKHVKAIVICGDASFPFEAAGAACGGGIGADYPKLFAAIHKQLTDTQMMSKYHNLGTAGERGRAERTQVPALAQPPADHGPRRGRHHRRALRRRDPVAATRPAPAVRWAACTSASCARNSWPTTATSTARCPTTTSPFSPWAPCSGSRGPSTPCASWTRWRSRAWTSWARGVALAWATEALEKGVIGPEQTIEKLAFGDAGAYCRAVEHLGRAPQHLLPRPGQGGPGRGPTSTVARTSPASWARRWPATPRANFISCPRPWASGTRTWIPGPIPGTRPTTTRTWTRVWNSWSRTSPAGPS